MKGCNTYLDSVEAIADEYSIKIYDFNLIKKGYLQLDTDDFYDMGHLNSWELKNLPEYCAMYLAMKT